MERDMAESWKNCFEEELICPICLHVFEEPIQLPCKHNYCRSCISEAWAKDPAQVRCPECNHAYSQKPALEKNIKLANIVEKFNALSGDKTPGVLHCILCRRGPALPAQKVCLRCNAPCCPSHVQTHLQQPSPAHGHLLVDTDEVRAWSCPQHDEYRLFHCEAEQAAVCQYCCFSRCASSHGHGVCDVEVRRNDIRAMLLGEQERVDERVQDIEEQLCRLETDKTLVEDAVSELRDQVRGQYRRMRAVLEEDLSESMAALDRAHARYRHENSQHALQLAQRRQEADKLLSAVATAFHRAQDLNAMKNTKPVKLLMDRCVSCLGTCLPPQRVGQLNSKLFLSEISRKERNLRKALEVPLSSSSLLLQTLPHPGSSSSGPEKRKHASAFPEGSAPGGGSTPSFLDSGPSSKQPYLGARPQTGAPPAPTEGPSSQHPPNPGASLGHCSSALGASSSTPSSTSSSVFPPPHYAGAGGPSAQPQYGGRKILMCTMDNCYCSGVPARAQPPYPRTGASFPWVGPPDFPPPHPPLAPGAPALPGLAMRDWMDPGQAAHRHPDFYGLYGQAASKHYVTS